MQPIAPKRPNTAPSQRGSVNVSQGLRGAQLSSATHGIPSSGVPQVLLRSKASKRDLKAEAAGSTCESTVLGEGRKRNVQVRLDLTNLHFNSDTSQTTPAAGPSAPVHTELTPDEIESIFLVWNDVMVKEFKSTVQTVEELRTLLQALHIFHLPGVEEAALKFYVDHRRNSHVDFDTFKALVQHCKYSYEDFMHRNPRLKDDLVDVFVALGGEWDTNGSIDNDAMRQLIRQYQLKVDFDRFLSLVDTDGDAQVDFEEFRKLIEEDPASAGPSLGPAANEETATTEVSYDASAGRQNSISAAQLTSLILPPSAVVPATAAAAASSTNNNPLFLSSQILREEMMMTPSSSMEHPTAPGGPTHSIVPPDGSLRKVPSSIGFLTPLPAAAAPQADANNPDEPISPQSGVPSVSPFDGDKQLTPNHEKQPQPLLSPRAAPQRHNQHSLASLSSTLNTSYTRGLSLHAAAFLTSPLRQQTTPHAPPEPPLPSARLAEKVAALVACPPPTKKNEKLYAQCRDPKPVDSKPFYDAVSNAVLNAVSLASFRDRCGETMRQANRLGDVVAVAPPNRNATHPGNGADMANDALIQRLVAERACKQPLVAENREKIAKIKKEDTVKRRKMLRDRQHLQKLRQANQAAAAAFSISVSAHNDDGAESGSNASGSPSRCGSARKLSRNGGSNLREGMLTSGSPVRRGDSFMFASNSGSRRRSVAIQDIASAPAGESGPGGNFDDDVDDLNSVYSTSSSQMSEDDRSNPYNVLLHYRSGRNTPEGSLPPTSPKHRSGSGVTQTSTGGSAPAEDASVGGPSGPTFVGVGGGPAAASPSERRKSLGAASAKAAARVKARERLFLSSIPTIRLSGNSNQLRCERIRPNTEEDEQAKTKARAPQVPVSKLTPAMRARLTNLTIGEKKDVCRVDEHGRERNELNAKLYECYYGRF